MTVDAAVAELRRITDGFSQELLAADPVATSRVPDDGGWTPKEIVGHLIDSAANNHQRFVRAQEGSRVRLPGYEQNHWVRVQGYRDADWSHLVTLWAHYNLHLANVIARIPAARYGVLCTIGSGAPVTLEFLIADYLSHLTHHVAQLRARL